VIKKIDLTVGNIDNLVNFYKEGYLELLKIVQTNNLLGKSNVQKLSLMAQVDKILLELDEGTKVWIGANIPEMYRQGSVDMVNELNKLKGEVKITDFNSLHQDAVRVIADESYLGFAEALKTVKRDIVSIFGLVTKQEIVGELATGIISGKTLPQVQKDIQAVLKDHGVVSLIDKGGKTWQLDTYSEMLARTKMVEAYRVGGELRLIENGYDLVQITVHGAADDCRLVEGKVYSLTGQTPGYPNLDEIMNMSNHIFRPNCRHRTIPYISELEKNPDEFRRLSNKDQEIKDKTLRKVGFSTIGDGR